MEKQILEMLVEMQKEQKEFQEETRVSFSDVNNRLDRIEKRLDGAGHQSEQVRVEDIKKRLTTVESDIYRMTR
ncbi:hypothetical protein ACIGHG_15660 [Bacillus sp. NPDC077411]|uniref:hypothetical protein n=1 Tax=Bacillus sp. NPDC077411 TaxID=3363947 RepID=UPI0037CB5F01